MKLYVQSAKRGFYTATSHGLVVSVHGSSSFPGAVIVQGVCYKDGTWHNDPKRFEIWEASAWNANMLLSRTEPWRWYELKRDDVAKQLDAGVHIDVIRGFGNGLEPWQPHDGYWERTDGWRVVLHDDYWEPDHTHCNADRETTLKYWPYHFEPLVYRARNVADAMAAVDQIRPWN